MNRLMAFRAKCDQIIQGIIAELAPLGQMVDVQIVRRTTVLTPPPISFEHTLAKQSVVLDTELQSGALLPKALHCLSFA